MAENAARNFAQRATAYTADTIEKSKTTAEEATRIMQHSYVTASKAAVDFNLKLPPWLKSIHRRCSISPDRVSKH
jgi:hypothetical protein